MIVHGRDQDPGYMVAHLVARLDVPGVAYVLPAAPGRSWYPGRYRDPRDANEPQLGAALASCTEAIASTGLPPERIVLAGFSQGGCLIADLVARSPAPYRGVALLTGALPAGTEPRPAPGLPVRMVSSRFDGWVAIADVEATARAFRAAGADVRLEVTADREHVIAPAAVAAVRALLT